MSTRLIGAASVVDHPLKPHATRGPMLAGVAAVALGLGGFTTFAAVVPVARAVIAPGVVTIESDRKRLQHLEGGIIQEIRVQEGQVVREGDLLFRMQPLQAEVNALVVENQIAGAEALEARLVAERDWAAQPDFATDQSPVGRQARADQARQFAERRASLQGKIAILESRIRQADDQINGYVRERDAGETQLQLMRSELADARELFGLRLIARPRLLALEREQARLSGAIGLSEANIARTRNIIDESRGEIAQACRVFAEQVSEDLRTTRDRLAELNEKRRAVRDVLARVEVRAPRSGVVQGLKVTTVGEVVQPGAVLLEVAPTDEAYVVNARVRPEDVDGLAPGMAAALRFTALPQRTTPVAEASLVSVSRDRLVDPQSSEPYFLVRARLLEDGLPGGLVARLVAGMPAEVIVPTEDRTLLSYLLRPLGDALARGFRER